MIRRINTIGVCVLGLSLFFGLGCTKKPADLPAQEPPAQSEPDPLPNVSYDGEEQIEPMFPEESAPAPAEEAAPTTTRLMKPNPLFAAEVGEAVKLPKVDDLVPQVAAYVEKLEKTIEDLDGSVRFTEDADVLYRDANTLALIALALGLSKEENQYKAAAPAIIEAAMKVEHVKSLDEAAKAVAAVKKSLTASGNPENLKWGEKVASLKPVMKAVPNINTLVKRNLRTEAALKKGGHRVIEGAAVLAVIGQGSLPNADETIKPDAAKQWKTQCLVFRDAALEVNRTANDYAAGKAKFDDVQTAYEALTESCDSCHKVFFEGEVPKE